MHNYAVFGVSSDTDLYLNRIKGTLTTKFEPRHTFRQVFQRQLNVIYGYQMRCTWHQLIAGTVLYHTRYITLDIGL